MPFSESLVPQRSFPPAQLPRSEIEVLEDEDPHSLRVPVSV